MLFRVAKSFLPVRNTLIAVRVVTEDSRRLLRTGGEKGTQAKETVESFLSGIPVAETDLLFTVGVKVVN